MPVIKELAVKKNGRYPYIVDEGGGEWGVPEDRIDGWMASDADGAEEDLAEFFREQIESPAECEVKFHCFSLDPLRMAVMVVDEGVEVEGDWWSR